MKPYVLVIGHAAAAGEAPANTLAGVRACLSAPAEAMEIDVQLCADGVPVLMHDDTVDRTTNKTGSIAELSLDQVQRLDAGHSQRIPTLEEALEIASGSIGVILELKVEGIGAEACAIVKRSGFSGAVIYASFLGPELRRVRQADPNATLLVLLPRQLPRDPIAEALALNASLVGLHFSTLTLPLLQTYHNLDRRVFVYTVNDPADIARMRDFGVDGIVSDFPDRL